MNILVTIDKNYLNPLLVLLKSIRISNPGTFFDIYVAHSSLEQSDFLEMERCMDLSRMVLHPVEIHDSLFEGAPTIRRLSTAKASYYRLLAIDFLPGNTKRVLYLDPDAVVINPLDKLYQMDLGDSLLAAAGHTTGVVELFNRARLGLKDRYINSGVILMDIEAMRREYALRDIFRYIEKNSAKKLKLLQGDQDVFNGLFGGRIAILDEKLYNLDEKTFRRFHRQIDLCWVRRNAVIVHYNGKHKPWKENYRGVLDGFYEETIRSEVIEFPVVHAKVI